MNSFPLTSQIIFLAWEFSPPYCVQTAVDGRLYYSWRKKFFFERISGKFYFVRQLSLSLSLGGIIIFFLSFLLWTFLNVFTVARDEKREKMYIFNVIDLNKAIFFFKCLFEKLCWKKVLLYCAVLKSKILQKIAWEIEVSYGKVFLVACMKIVPRLRISNFFFFLENSKNTFDVQSKFIFLFF